LDVAPIRALLDRAILRPISCRSWPGTCPSYRALGG
jgi:hypothetical protein